MIYQSNSRFSQTAVDFNQDGGDGSMKMASDSSTWLKYLIGWSHCKYHLSGEIRIERTPNWLHREWFLKDIYFYIHLVFNCLCFAKETLLELKNQSANAFVKGLINFSYSFINSNSQVIKN